MKDGDVIIIDELLNIPKWENSFVFKYPSGSAEWEIVYEISGCNKLVINRTELGKIKERFVKRNQLIKLIKK